MIKSQGLPLAMNCEKTAVCLMVSKQKRPGYFMLPGRFLKNGG